MGAPAFRGDNINPECFMDTVLTEFVERVNILLDALFSLIDKLATLVHLIR